MTTEGADAGVQILVVDDEKPLAGMIAAYLSRDGYQTRLAHTGPDAVAAALEHAPDVVILDLGLPGMDGVEVCRQIRTFSDCYIIMVTARQDEVDKLIGLSVGADDYITKPFSARELVARVHTVLRRPRTPTGTTQHVEQPARVFGDLRVDTAGREVHVAGVLIDLTPTEFDILATLTARPKLAFSRQQILDEVWGEGWVGDDHIVDVHVAHLRHKLGDDSSTPRYVRTVRGVGYRMGPGVSIIRWARETLAGRLMLGQMIVLVASVLTAGLIASVVGPQIFHDHLLQSGDTANSPELGHIELAYREANTVVLGVALLTSLVCAMVVTWLVSRPLRRSLNELTDGARELSRGHYSHRVRAVGGGSELDTFAAAFNTMAVRLDDVEATRRRLLTDLAHELRTPIATLTLYHEGLYDGITDLNADTRNVLTAQTDRLARLAEDIDDVSRAEEGRLRLDRQLHKVQELITTTTDSVRARYVDKGVDLVVDVAPEPALGVDVDSARIGQVLGNLLTNALRHTPPGGRVTITARLEPEEVAITIVDSGEGILPAQLPHVFERFYRGDTARDRDRSGSGIGLTISKAIIDAHGGTITAHSDGAGQGARFEILLPRKR